MLLFDPLFSEPIWPIWSERRRENKGPAELTQIYEKWKGGRTARSSRVLG